MKHSCLESFTVVLKSKSAVLDTLMMSQSTLWEGEEPLLVYVYSMVRLRHESNGSLTSLS